MKWMLPFLALTLLSGQAHSQAPSAPASGSTGLVCSGATPVKLFVGFAIQGLDDDSLTFGNSFACFDKEIQSMDDVNRLTQLLRKDASKMLRQDATRQSLWVLGVSRVR